MKQHPLSAAFPAMAAEDFLSLKDSIANIGVQNPITLFEGMVIDGWHRFTAANEVGMSCPSVELGDIDPRDFVLAQNKARRHVTQAQLAMAVTAVHAWNPVGKPKSGTECPITKTTAQLAEIAGASERTIKQAKAVQSKGVAEVQDAVKKGEIGLPKAAKIAQLPKEDQAAAIGKPTKKVEPEDADYFGPSAEEIASAEAAAAADTTELLALLQADDKLAAAAETIKRLKLQLAVSESGRDGYMNRCNELIARLKTVTRKLAKTEAPK